MMDRHQRKFTRFYERILQLAELNGDKDQVQIARRVGVSKGTVTNWQQGKPPRPKNVLDAAHAYGVDEKEMLLIAYLPESGEPKENPKDSPGAKKMNKRQTRAIKPRYPL